MYSHDLREKYIPSWTRSAPWQALGSAAESPANTMDSTMPRGGDFSRLMGGSLVPYTLS